MAFGEVGVFEVGEVLRLWLRGEGIRAAERLAGVDRKTVRRYVAAELDPVARTPDVRWPRPPARMSACLPHTHLSSASALSSWPHAGHTPVAKLAKDLRISESCLRSWMAQADVDASGGDARLTSAEKKELAQLRRANRKLELENEILKRAAAYFAKENVLPK